MSENYQYAECKHCGQSVMEGQIHNCRKMLLAEIEELKERVEKWKTWHDAASEDAKKWRKDAQKFYGVLQKIANLHESSELWQEIAREALAE